MHFSVRFLDCEAFVKTVFVSQLKADMELFDQPFLLLDVTERKTRDGRPFILFTLSDKSGHVGGVYWNVPDEVVDKCQNGSVVLVTGAVRIYNKRLQVTALDLQPFEPATMADFLSSSRRAKDEMEVELRQIIGDLGEPLCQLLTDILLEPAFLHQFSEAPAALMMHHAYVGGLLEHSLSMIPFCRLAAERYPMVDLDLLIAGALLHDLGKVLAYEPRAAFPLTDEERLVGHITRGAVMVEEAIAKIAGFPADLRQQLLHLLVSHHGKMEWGSPVPPRTLEAVLLHQIDLLDSRVQGFIDHVSAEPGDATWSSTSPMFGYELMRKNEPDS
jgi:3'-5' exoribonuclease